MKPNRVTRCVNHLAIHLVTHRVSHRVTYLVTRRVTQAGSSLAAMLLAHMLAACGGTDSSQTSLESGNRAAAAASANAEPGAMALLGRQIFFDASLSASGKMACASCHDPAFAFAQPNALAAQFGGSTLQQQGLRAVPSLRYLGLTPVFSIDEGGTASGGFNRDGRAATLASQAEQPFLATHEMANESRAALVARLRAAPYAQQFESLLGSGIFEQVDLAFEGVLNALQRYQIEDRSFHPYSSRYDRYLSGEASLSTAELRGLALFNDAAKGNCAACHPSARGSDGAAPLFTDFTYDNLGLPRNPAIAANVDPRFFDLGLCGPDRTDLASAATARTELCGAFKVPTLRNVATRKVFFHNGSLRTLRDAVAFYVRRDTHPQEWYTPGIDGLPEIFNDLAPALQGNVNSAEGPYDRQPGMAPALTADEIDDLVLFLGTLTDVDLARP
ncbi:MAG: cytochrome-c peroxidase [Janthinobacterium lividum]